MCWSLFQDPLAFNPTFFVLHIWIEGNHATFSMQARTFVQFSIWFALMRVSIVYAVQLNDVLLGFWRPWSTFRRYLMIQTCPLRLVCIRHSWSYMITKFSGAAAPYRIPAVCTPSFQLVISPPTTFLKSGLILHWQSNVTHFNCDDHRVAVDVLACCQHVHQSRVVYEHQRCSSLRNRLVPRPLCQGELQAILWPCCDSLESWVKELMSLAR